MNDQTTRRAGIGAALALLAVRTFAAPPPAPPAPAAATVQAAADPPADLTLGNEVVLRLRASAGGLTPQQRVGVVESRLVAVLGTPGLRPSDVVVYAPAKGAPVVYALGRRLITVDAATVKAAGTPGAKPLDVATRWAKRFQQVLPRVNYRPSNAPEPKVPAHPPLLVTPDFAKVGGNKGFVTLRGKPILTLHGPQNGGLTAQERADALSARLERLANSPQVQGPNGVAVQTGKTAAVQVAQTPFVTVDASEAKFAATTPAKLAAQWAAHIRAALGTIDPNALPAAVAQPATPTAQAPVTPASPLPLAPAAPTPPTVPGTPAATPPAAPPPAAPSGPAGPAAGAPAP